MVDVIQGGEASDQRGSIRFVNDFDMTEVKRFYIIENGDSNIIRGWRGHKMEKRWFYVLSGQFKLSLVKIDNWANPNQDLPVETMLISAIDQQVVVVPEGYATAFQAVESSSKLMVFANYGIENAKNDDYLWPQDYFFNKK